MPTQFNLDNARDDDISGLPEGAQELYRRLEQDGTPSRETIAQINQRLQQRVAQFSAQFSATFSATQTAAYPAPEPLATVNAPTAAPHALEITRRAPHSTTVRRWVAVLATAAVVIAFVVALSVNAGLRPSGPSSHPTQPGLDLSGVPLTPVATPGPAAGPLSLVVTALHRQGNCDPIDPSSYFHAGDVVWVFVMLKQPALGHTISVRWFLNESEIHLPSPDKTTLILEDNNPNACFALQYPTPGKGSVKVYWDRPANDSGNNSTDPALMATVNFAVLPHGYGTPTSGPTGMRALTCSNNLAPASAGATRVCNRPPRMIYLSNPTS